MLIITVLTGPCCSSSKNPTFACGLILSIKFGTWGVVCDGCKEENILNLSSQHISKVILQLKLKVPT